MYVKTINQLYKKYKDDFHKDPLPVMVMTVDENLC